MILESNFDRLAHNGGVAHSIAIAAGPSLQEECRKIILKQKEGRIPTGEVVHTGAGKLSCKYVIHAGYYKKIFGLLMRFL